MADFKKGKEREREGGPATPAIDSLTAGDGSTGVESETAAPALPSTNPSASAGAPQDSERAPAASTNSTELPSETVQGPAPTAQLVNPLVLVVSIPGLFFTARRSPRNPSATNYSLLFSITSSII